MKVNFSPFRALAVVGALLSLACVPSPEARADAVDDYVRAQMQKDKIPGLSLAVIHDGKIVKALGYGLANVELAVPATADTVYEIGSLTKQFTAAAILLLVEQGKLGLDDRVSKYVSNTPDAWKDITVRHLLTHTSGIKNYTALPNFMSQMAVLPTTPEALVKLMAPFPLEFAPGEKWNYSNTGYFLLGLVIEKVSGKSYAEFLRERLFAPLQMTATSVNDEKTVLPNRASGYSRDGETLQNATEISMTWPGAAGAMVSTVNDLAKWDAALSGDSLLTKTSRDVMWTPVKLSDGKSAEYGFGWGVGTVNGHRNLSHGGGIPGFLSFISRFPEDGWSVIVLTNLGNGGNPGTIAGEVIGRYLPAVAPPALMPIEDKEPTVTALVKSVYEQAAQGKLDAALFTPELARAASAQLTQGLAEVLRKNGTLKSVTLVERTDDGPNRLYRYRLGYENATLLTLCVLDKDGKISGLTIKPE